MKKIILYGFLATIAAAALALVGYIYLENLSYRNASMAEISRIMGTNVSSRSFSFNPLNKTLSIRNLQIDNPSKYNTLYAVMIPKLLVHFRELDLEQRKFIVSGISISEMDVNYEADGTLNSNLSDILQSVSASTHQGDMTLHVEKLQVDPAMISMNTVRFKREIGSLTSKGFVLNQLKFSDTRSLLEIMLQATLMHTAATISQDDSKRVDFQFKQGTKDVLTGLVRDYPDLARSLKI